MKTIFVGLLLISNIALAQEKQSEQSHKSVYIYYNSLLNTINYDDSHVPVGTALDLKERFKSLPISKDSFDVILNEFKRNSNIKIEKFHFGGYNLEFSPNFTDLFKMMDPDIIRFKLRKDFLGNAFSIRLLEHDVINKKGEKISIEDNFGYYPINGTTLLCNVLEEEDKMIAPFTGNATFKIKLLTDYNTVTLSKDNIGETFALADKKYVLIDIIDNKIILELKGNTTIETSEFEVIYLSEDRKSEINNGVSGRFLMSKRSYEIFKNKELTLEEFKTLVPEEKELRKLVEEQNYFVLMGVVPIKDFILVKYVYGHEETIKLGLD